MTLRSRLTAAFLTVVLGPVLLATAIVAVTVTEVRQDRASDRFVVASEVAGQTVAGWCGQLRTAAEAVAVRPAVDRADAAADVVGRDLASAVRVSAADGTVTVLTEGAPPAPWADCDGPTGARNGIGRYQAVGARAVVRGPTGSREAEVWAAVRVDEAFIRQVADASGVDVTLLSGAGDPADPGAVAVHSTDPAAGSSVAAARGLVSGARGESADDRWVWRLEPRPGQPLPLVLSTPRTDPRGTYLLLAAGVGLAALAGVAAAWWLARSTGRTLQGLAVAADRVAEGDLSVRVPVAGADEAGRLAAAFNRMTLRTQTYVQALTASRDQLRGHLSVLGDALSSTHDLDRMLRVILQTALTAIGARSGAVLLLDPMTGELAGQRADRGGAPAELEPTPIEVPVGEGLLGAVAATGQAIRGPVGPSGPALHPDEPRCVSYVAVPIIVPSDGPPATGSWQATTVRGVLALYDRFGTDGFDDNDLATLRRFAEQAGVAVENVRTHEEAQRLSLTDPLTGLWNYRYLRESMRREVERASRFRRMLCVLALDLDRFKEVNDAHGHPAGDAVLAELARRIRVEVREVDLAFRQGGEEFVVLLPETDVEGGVIVAQRLRDAVRGTPIMVAPRRPAGQIRIDITVSIGIAVFPDHAITPQGVLDAADEALYAAKAAGRDTYRIATGTPAPVATAELPIRAGARTPDHDLPQAGNGAAAAGGAQPPRQTRGR